MDEKPQNLAGEPASVRPTLTRIERRAFPYAYNLADGHARLTSTSPSQMSSKAILADAWAHAYLDQCELEEGFERAFVAAIGKGTWTSRPRPILLSSASAAVDAVGKWLVSRGLTRVGLLEPAFDNLHLILKRLGIRLEPLPEDADTIVDRIDGRNLDAVLLIQPNNPTGWILKDDELSAVLRASAASSTSLVIDQSFRAFVPEGAQMAGFDEAEATVITIEDTGKTWPAHELKLALICTNSFAARRELELIVEEICLAVSPFVLALVASVLDHERETNRRSRDAVTANRQLLRGLGVSDHSREYCELSVKMLSTPVAGSAATSHLAKAGVAVLPLGQFYWSAKNDPFGIRVALFRDEVTFAEAASRLVSTIEELRS